MNACAQPIEFTDLLEYWLGELAAAEDEAIETHLLGCGHCSAALASLVALGAGIRAAFRKGAVHAVVSPAFLATLRSHGLRVREYPIASGDSVNCTIGAADDAVVSRLQAPLAGVLRVDLVSRVRSAEGEQEFRLADIPFDPLIGEVLFCPSAAWLRRMPAHTDRVSLVAVDESGESPLGEYTFVHTPP